ncbi:uncharacterized protein J3D65DRAFT_604205 [Phyllosticta citribraziliensis]|uniref:Uncharacterized protein n=1 Tax=Phyllosticta citribraziliensis TaxID=989973 RepID=A0ABR1LHN9_9PEZI
MPAIRFSASPIPAPSRPRHDTVDTTQSAPARASLNSHLMPSLTRLDASLEETIGLLLQSQALRLDNQDAEPPKALKHRQLQSASEANKIERPRSMPSRPVRPSSMTMAGSQKYLKPSLTPSPRYSSTVTDVRPESPLLEDPDQEQELKVPSTGSSFLRSPRKSRLEKKKPVAHLRLSLQEGFRNDLEKPKHMSDSTLDSTLATPNDFSKEFSKPTSALSHWIDNAAWPPWSPRSRAASGAAETDTDPNDELSEPPGSASKVRRRLFRPSDASSQPSMQEGSSSRRNILRGLGMSWENRSSSSDSSWTSFGCIDGMRRPDLEDVVDVGEKEVASKEEGVMPLTPGKRSLTKAAGRRMLRKMTG